MLPLDQIQSIINSRCSRDTDIRAILLEHEDPFVSAKICVEDKSFFIWGQKRIYFLAYQWAQCEPDYYVDSVPLASEHIDPSVEPCIIGG